MKKFLYALPLILALVIGLFSCNNDETEEPMLIVKFKFDPNQPRLNNLGAPTPIPVGNAAQTPIFNSISAHYLEFAPTAYTQLGEGAILYHAPETTEGGANAIDFGRSKILGENEIFLKIPLSQIASGNYRYVRCSLAYQNYEISVRHAGNDYNGTLASFVGFNTYLDSFAIGQDFIPEGNKPQG